MKAFMVTQGEYSDYSVCCVFLKKEDAEKYITDRQTPGSYSSFNDIEDIEVHEAPVAVVMMYSANWTDRNNMGIQEWDYTVDAGTYPDFTFTPGRLGNEGFVQAVGIDKERVLKAVSDYRAQYLAKKEGIA